MMPIQQEGEEAECATQQDCKSGWMTGMKLKTILAIHAGQVNSSTCQIVSVGSFKLGLDMEFSYAQNDFFFRVNKAFLKPL